MSDIQRFEAELKSNGYEESLNALAAHSKNFSTDIKEVADTYNHYILLAEQNLKSRFYDYEIPKGKATISEQSHRWSAYAQYNRHENTMIAFSSKAPLADYLGESEFNLAIAPFISVHEMYPGHHLSAYAGLSNPICPGDNPTSFSWLGEGWATYVEFVADEYYSGCKAHAGTLPTRRPEIDLGRAHARAFKWPFRPRISSSQDISSSAFDLYIRL